MQILTRPHAFLREEFGRDFTLIYGDVEGEDVVLYATQPLEGYTREGEVFVKKVDPSKIPSPHICLLTDRFYRSFPIQQEMYRGPKFELEIETREGPNEVEKAIFGINGSFAYVVSRNIIEKINEPGRPVFVSTFMNPKSQPEDIILAHEGTHLVTAQQVNRMAPEYGSLILEDVVPAAKRHALREAVAFWGELKYLLRFHPQLETEWRAWRSQAPGFAYRNAYRIFTEHPDKVEEMVERAKAASESTPQ